MVAHTRSAAPIQSVTHTEMTPSRTVKETVLYKARLTIFIELGGTPWRKKALSLTGERDAHPIILAMSVFRSMNGDDGTQDSTFLRGKVW